MLHDAAAAMLRLFDEGEPAVVRGLGSLFSEAEVFEWIKRVHPPSFANTAADKIVALQQSWGLSPHVPDADDRPQPGRSAEVYRQGAALLDPSPFVPQPEHDTFAQWVEATRSALGGAFGMQAPALQCASFDALERLHTLLGPVLDTTGPRSYRYNAFLGDYRRTPFGFHVDPHQEAVFQFAITGARRGLFWEGLTLSPADAAWVEDSNGRTVPAREPEVVLDLQPGDLVFWPGTHVHGFEAEGPTLALSMVVDRASPRSQAEVAATLSCHSVGGKTALPAVTDAQPPQGTVHRRPGFAIHYERCDDALVVGVCGRTFVWPDRNSVAAAVRLFERLNAGDEHDVAELVRACTDEWLTGEEVVEALAMLRSLGALR